MGIRLNASDSARLRDVVEEQERILRYPERFGAREALALGARIAGLVPEYECGVVVSIIRESDGLELLAWADDDRERRHFGYASGKRLGALACGHASCWAQFSYAVDGSCADVISKETPSLGAAGAFPIRVGDEWVATLAVSGLHDGMDQHIIIRALSEELGVEAPQFDLAVW